MIIGLCERFHCLPSQLREEDASLIHMLMVLKRGRPAEPDGGEGSA